MSLLALLAAGCSSAPPDGFTVESTLDLRPNEPRFTRRLDEAQAAELVAAMRSVADGPPANPQVPLQRRLRWSDLDDAVVLAGDAPGVAMAVVRATDQPDGSRRYEMLTFDDLPVVLTVHPTGDADLYRAEASVGRFPERHRDQAAALVAELRRAMEGFGRKLGF